MDHLFQSIGEPFFRHFKKRLDQKYSPYLKRSSEIKEEAAELAKQLKLDETNFNRIGIYGVLQQEQDGGKQKLLTTGFDETLIDSIKLSSEEMKFYNFLRDTVDSLFPEYKEMLKNVWNVDLRKAKNYLPFLTDFEAMSDFELRERLLELPEFPPMIMFS